MLNFFRRRTLFAIVALGGFLGVTDAETLNPGSVEGVAFVGSSAANGTIGGGLAKALNTRWQVIGEVAYLHSNAAELGVNGHYVFPLDNPKFTPYLLVGFGVLHAPRVGGRDSDTVVGANLGGGLRWRTGRNWGIRPELKVIVGDGVHGRLIIGLYYNFGR